MCVTLQKSAIFLLRGTKWVTRAGKVDVFFFCSGNQLKHRIPFISSACAASYKKKELLHTLKCTKSCFHQVSEQVAKYHRVLRVIRNTVTYSYVTNSA